MKDVLFVKFLLVFKVKKFGKSFFKLFLACLRFLTALFVCDKLFRCKLCLLGLTVFAAEFIEMIENFNIDAVFREICLHKLD